jgi:hypothetical protein
MKLMLCLVFCLGAALARVDDWSWNDNVERFRNRYEDSIDNVCRVSGRKVNTFNKVDVSVPLTTEFVVLSKDCSSNPSFVVLIRKLSQSTDRKELKIKTRTHKVVITPLSQSGEQLRITVNDRPIKIHEDIELKENGYPVIRIVKEGSQIKVELLTKGINVIFNGYTCKVHLPQVSRSNLCGLCGQTDSQYLRRDFTNSLNFNDFFGLDEQEREYPVDRDCEDDDYTCSNKRQWWNLFDDRTCQKNRRQCGYDKPEWTIDEDDNEYNRYENEYNPFESKHENEYNTFESKYNTYEQPEWTHEQSDEYETEFDRLTSGKRIVLKHKLVDLEDKICVSLKRIPQCQVNTHPINKIQKRVPFHCVSRNDRRVAKFENRILSGQRIPEIEHLTPTMTRTVIVPTKCVKSFY